MTNKKQTALAIPFQIWLKYGVIFTLLWILLTQGNIGSWVIGILVVPFATWCAVRLFFSSYQTDQSQREYPPRLRVSAWLSFIPFFLEQSFKGGLESALFAIHPQKHTTPVFIDYTTRLTSDRAKLFFINLISLLPGTVSARWQDDKLTIHALDRSANHHQALCQCEQRIAALFGLELKDTTQQHDETSK